jgi:hypothetical protein
MSERLKEHDWKSCVRPQRCTAGSNPALSAILYFLRGCKKLRLFPNLTIEKTK